MDATLDLSVVVVTWNCRELALECIRTITTLTAGVSCEILVIDNASADGTPDAVAASFPAVRVIRNACNSGFAAANNVAFSQARGRYWLLLNPDAFPTGTYVVTRLLAFMAANPRIGAVGPRLRHANGRHQVGDAGFAPTLATVATHAFALMRVSSRMRGVFLTGVSERTTSIDVDWLCGACMMVRAQTAREVGLLDESFFMYGEDIEWGCRMRDGGWRVVYLPGMEAMHLGGGTQGPGSAAISTTWLDGLGEMYRRRNGNAGMFAFQGLLVLGYGARALLYGAWSLLPGQRALRGRASAMVVYALYGWRMRPHQAGRP